MLENLGQYLTPLQRKLLLETLDIELRPEHRRRIQIMLLADEGQSQAQICKALGCSQEAARYWMVIAETGQVHKWNDRPIGRPKMVSEQYLRRLRELFSCNPRDCGYSFRNWTAQWLGRHLAKEFGVNISDCHINRLLREMGLSTRQAKLQGKE